jgi:hypothetical protein
MKAALGYLMSDPWFQKSPSKEQKQDEVVAVMRDFNPPARELLMERNPQYASDRVAMKSLSDYMAEGLSRRAAAGQAAQDMAAMGLPKPTRM